MGRNVNQNVCLRHSFVYPDALLYFHYIILAYLDFILKKNLCQRVRHNGISQINRKSFPKSLLWNAYKMWSLRICLWYMEVHCYYHHHRCIFLLCSGHFSQFTTSTACWTLGQPVDHGKWRSWIFCLVRRWSHKSRFKANSTIWRRLVKAVRSYQATWEVQRKIIFLVNGLT